MSNDAYAVLGLDDTASAADVRRARRDLAKAAHPDTGGSESEMQRINAAAAALLRRLTTPEPPAPSDPSSSDSPPHDVPARDGSDGRRVDVPSFTVEALPVETFEALLFAAAALGDVEDDDPPYELGVLMAQPLACWCRLYVVPDAGASTVSLAIAPAADARVPSLDAVRDAWITELNRLDWSSL